MITQSKIKSWIKRTLKENRQPKFLHSDIFLVEFPKSGITWLSFILANVELQLVNIQREVNFFNVNVLIPGVENLKHSGVNRSFSNTFIKSHDTYTPEYPWIIYLIRNPLNVMVSFYNYQLDHGYSGSFGDFLHSEKHGIKAWLSHVNNWFVKSRNRANYILLKYEDLKSDTKGTIKNLYHNLGYTLTEEQLNFAVNNSSLDKMKTKEEDYKKLNPGYNINFVGNKGKKLSIDDISEEDKSFVQNYVRSNVVPELSNLYTS